MAQTDVKQQKRWELTKVGISAFTGLLAAVILQVTSGADQGIFYWVLIAVLVSSIAEAGWALVKYLRLSREAERLN